MADFLDSEAEESGDEQIDDDVSPIPHRSHKKLAVESEEEDEEDDGEEVNDLIDDRPIEDESDNESDRSRKRKKSDDEDDEDFDDRLEDEDYELLEENLGVKVQKKRRRVIQEEDSDDEGTQDLNDERDTAASQLFDGSENEEERPPARVEFASEESDGEDSENDGFIVDDEDRPLTDKRKKKKPIFADSTLQEAQDIFGVDFDYDDFEKYEDQYYEEEEEEEEDEYEDEEQRTLRLATKKASKKKRKPKSLYEIYEPIELERAGFTDEDSKIRSQDVPERMQLRSVPVIPGTEDEIEEEAEWIFDTVFKNRSPTDDNIMKPLDDDGDPKPSAPVAAAAAVDDDDGDWDKDETDNNNTATVSVLPTRASETAPPPARTAVVVDDDDDWDNPTPAPVLPQSPPLTPPPSQSSTSMPPPETAPAPPPTFGDEDDWDADATAVVPAVVPNFVRPEKNTEEIKTKFMPRIRKALEFMRNQHLEVPFIAFYRKEYVSPELDINDLWTIYREDARFCQLRARKFKVINLYENMQEYHAHVIMSKPDDPIPDSMRLINEEDLEQIRSIQTHEELKDTYMQFSLYYGDDVVPMRDYHKNKRKDLARTSRQADVDPENPSQEPTTPPEEITEIEEDPQSSIKRRSGTGSYAYCRKMGLDTFAKKFGLSPEKFAQNLRDNYQKFEVEQYPEEPAEVAREFVSPRLPTTEDVLKAVKYMVALQISRDPLARKCVREVFCERANLDIYPTKKGMKEIDEGHSLYSLKYVKGKPIRDLTEDMFLKLTAAEEDGLIVLKLGDVISGITMPNYIDEVKQLYYKDEYSTNVQLWNDLRGEIIDFAMTTQIYPVLRKELRAVLATQAKDHILRKAAAKLRKWLEVKPYDPQFNITPEDDEEEDWSTTKGVKVLALAFEPDFRSVAFACLVNPDGEPSDYLRLANITKSLRSFRENDKLEKEADLMALRNFIRVKKPHVIVIGGESREAIMIQEEVKVLVDELEREDGFPTLSVEIFDNQLAKVYANSIKATNEFRDYPSLLRQAISLGRRMQDPLIEFSQLCTPDDEILSLKCHPFQDHVPKEDLLEYLQLEFVNRANEVGVDVNRAIAYPCTSNLLQFICGLGPRKALQLMKTLKQNNHRLENRTQLITLCHMGPKIFINCSGFIKIDTNSLGDSTEAYVEVLDSSRVHPETYEWARKMAVDALDLDDEDTNPATALEEILDSPERLKDLDLDAFADELARQGFGNKRITLYDIRTELNIRYADFRFPYESPKPEELFNMLTKETPDTFYIGKLVVVTVLGILHKKPQGEQLDNAVPVRNDETGMWQCSFCLKNDFPDLSEVWNHFDANACPGQAIGVRVRLDNGISGFIPILKLSDKQVTNPENRVRRNQTIHCRISKIDVQRFSVECTSRTSDLIDSRNEWRPSKDPYYDNETEEINLKKEEEIRQFKQKMTYVKRVIVHPSFKNISFREAEKLIEQMDQGEVIIRPSSKGADHLTVTWKVCDGIYQHIDVKEQGKENAFSLGKSLWIGNEEFEDLDEIIARHINPMASYARDILNYKYFKIMESRQSVDEYLLKEKERSANKIHYLFYPSKEFPGKFVLAYLPKDKVRHEFITLKPEGLRFRQQQFENMNPMLKWFKEHYREPPPSLTPVQNLAVAVRTPFATPGNNDAASRVGGPAPSAYSGITQSQIHATPHYTTPGQAYTPFAHTPYTPTAQTPYMTPYQQQPSVFPSTPATIGSQHAHVAPGFAHPGNATPGQRPQPQQQPRIPSAARSCINTSGANESLDWRKAAEAWAKSQQKGVQYSRSEVSFGTTEGSRTPATRNAAQVISDGIAKTRQLSSAHNFISHKSPKGGRDSLRSTPKTNFSPRSMIESSLGDETPLFDEN